MKKLDHYTKSPAWIAGLLSMGLLAGCGGGNWDSSAEAGVVTSLPGAPTVSATSPADDATDIAISTSVNATFNEAMDPSSISTTSFTLTAPGNTAVAGSVSYSELNATATFAPSKDLVPATTYTAVVSSDVRDATEDNLASNYMWSFTTAADDEAPQVQSSNPSDNGSNVCINRSIAVTFSEPVEASTIVSPALTFSVAATLSGAAVDGDVSLDAIGSTATFTPTGALDPDVEYTATVTTDVQDLSGDALETEVEWTFTTSDVVCQETITLGATKPYGVLSNTGVTLGGGPDSTTGLRIDGDVGIFPAGACNGCDSSTVSGLIEIGTTAAQDAMTDLEAAYNEATNRASSVCTLIDSGVLATNPPAACGGNADGVFAPGLYWSGTSIAIPAGGTITLDAGNDNNAVFIFQSESTIDTIGGDTHMILQNGAQAKNVFWVAQSSATIGGANSDFVGTILALVSITVNTGTDMTGRALARSAEVVVQDQALITVPAE